jgi:thiamine biosynthesis lipoprotein
MGCEMRIELFAQTTQQAQSLARAAFDRVHALEDVLSDYRATSQVGRLATDSGRPIPISRELYDALERSIRISCATNGCFDATIGASSQLWRQARKDGLVPSEDAIARANAMGGWNEIVLNSKANPQSLTLTFLRPGIRLDFGAIGKGIAAQAALETLRTLGTTVAMCSLAGDIACGDAPIGSDGWMIDVESGIEGVPSCRLILRNQCVSTSGDESQHLDANGIRYSHVIDPRTGHAVTRRIAATVACRDGAVADALATALCVGGPELLAHVSDLHNARGDVSIGDFQARVVETKSSGQITPTITVTSGWNALVAPANSRDQVSRPALAGADQTATKAASNSSDQKAPLPK